MRSAWLGLGVAALLSGCGTPKCSDEEVVEIVQSLLDEQAAGVAIVAHRVTAMAVGGLDPGILPKLQNGDYYDAMDLMTAALEKQPPSDARDTWLSVVASARESSVTLADITTTDEADKRSHCAVTVTYDVVSPPAEELGELAEIYAAFSKSVAGISQQRHYESYRDDDGEVLVDLLDAE